MCSRFPINVNITLYVEGLSIVITKMLPLYLILLLVLLDQGAPTENGWYIGGRLSL